MSWRQQPDNTSWHSTKTIAGLVIGATDAQVDTARDGGFDHYLGNGAGALGNGWDTETNVDDPADPYIALLAAVDTAYATAAGATTATNVAGGFDEGSKIVAGLKAFRYTNATNTRVDLPYSFTGSIVNIDRGVTLDGNNSTTALSYATPFVLPTPTTGIDTDLLINGMSVAGDVLFTNSAWAVNTDLIMISL